jgi:hypothetical protein
MERECLDLLLRGSQPLVICPARSLEHMRVPVAWRPGIDAGRVLIVSSFAARHRRVTAVLAQERNHLVGSLAREVIIPHAVVGGRTDCLCRELVTTGKSIWTLDPAEANAAIQAGVQPTTAEDLAREWWSRDAR